MSAPETLITVPRRWWQAFSALSSDAIFVIDPAGAVSSWNAAAERLWGYAPEEVVGQPVRRLVPQDRLHEIDRIMESARRGQSVAPFETLRIGKDGSPVDISLATTPLVDESGAMLGIIAIARDLSESKATEKRLAEAIKVRQEFETRLVDLNRQLRQRVQTLETLLEVLPVGIGISYDPDCSDVRTNREFARMLGVPTERNVSKTAAGSESLPFRITKDGTEVAAEALPMQVAAKHGTEVSDVELDIERQDGGIDHILAFAAPLLQEDGTSAGAVGVFVDVTEKRRAEQALLDANAIKDEFLALVSHELRTPLTVVVGLSRVLARSQGSLDPETFQSTVEQLRNESEQLGSVIENMLVLARLDHQEASREPLRLLPIIERTVALHRMRLPGRTIELDTTPVGIAEGNGQWIEQVVGNLLTNAHKYSAPGTPITVRVEERDGEVVVTVADRGDGLDENDVEHLFEPFYRSSGKSASTRPGLGVGLTVCRRLVELQGGKITARAREGGGSEFSFTLPCVDDSPE